MTINALRVGLLGGTFDPVHRGHIAMAEYALVHDWVDEVWFLPAGVPAWKRPVASVMQRLEMLHLAIAGHTKMRVEEIECSHRRTAYTAETLSALMAQHSGYQWHFLLGTDAAKSFHKWKNWEFILSNASLLVFARGEDKLSEILLCSEESKGMIKQIKWASEFNEAASSTELRERLARAQDHAAHDIDGLCSMDVSFESGLLTVENEQWLHPEVLKYIKKHRLYQ